MNDKDRVTKYAARKGVICPREVEDMGISRQVLYKLYQEGGLDRIARGIYSIPNAEITEYHTYAQVAVAFPSSVICLLSSLQFHDLTTQMPHRVWVALNRDTDRRSRKSSLFPVSIVRFSGESFSEGIEVHNIEGVDVRIYSAAKTVADCFKYRNKIGLEIAIEALTDCVRQKRATRDQIWYFAKICRVSKVIRPYMEAIV